MISLPRSVTTSFTRVHALDAARGLALLIGVVYHALESLVPFKIYNVAQDCQTSTLLDGVYYLCHIFRMQVFFLMAGYFAHLLYYHRGPQGFIANRTKRLVIPFLIFWPINYILVTSLWVWNIHRNSGLPLEQVFAKLPPHFRFVDGFPLMHLWFLYFLIIFYVGVFLFHPLVDRWLDPSQKLYSAADQALAFVMTRWWGCLALACLMIGPMLKMSAFVGVETSNASLWPKWPPFVLYGLYFTLGWLLHRRPDLLTNLRKYKVINLSFSVLFICFLLALKLLYDPIDLVNLSWLSWLMNLSYTFASMLSACTFLGYALAYFSLPNPQVRYLSDFSYLGYLIHYPIVVFFQILVAPYYWHWSIKLVIILGATLILLRLTYTFSVRSRWLGILLNKSSHQPNQKWADAA